MALNRFHFLTVLLALSACGGGPATSPKPASEIPKQVSTAQCPAQDFESFLRVFASSKEMLTRYSADQIDVTEWKDVDDLTAGSKVTKVPRLAYDGFSLIYRDGAFHHRSSDGSVDAHAEMPKIVATKNGYDVSYVYGMSEGNSWHFEKHDGCWLLTADPQPFSP